MRAVFVLDGIALEPVTQPDGPGYEAPGGIRGAILRRYLDAASRPGAHLDELTIACLDELNELER